MDAQEKRARYEAIREELERRFAQSADATARMATAAALINKHFSHVFWSGFYLLAADGELTVGPYQKTPACVVLTRHQGVCWAAIDRRRSICVPNVHDFPGHIQCEGPSNSEVAIPFCDASGEPRGVLHLDSGDFDGFDEVDIEQLERIAALFGPLPRARG